MNKTKESIYPLESVLFSMFVNNGYSNFSAPEHLWAVVEALNRVLLSTQPLIDWKVRKSRREHRCSSRGCLIKPGGKYYLRRNGAKETKVCVRCEARLWRDDPGWLLWRIRKANKDHECARGCNIKSGEFYFIHSGDHSTDGTKLCARCMALVLYFKNVEKLKPYRFFGWDYQRCEPKRVEKPLLLTGMINDSYFFPEKIRGGEGFVQSHR